MVLLQKHFLFSLLIAINLHADTNQTTEYNYLDDTHNLISDTIHDLSDSLDAALCSELIDTNASKIEKTAAKGKVLDSFFQTKKFIDQTKSTFVRINFNTLFQSKDKEAFKYKIRAHIPLSRTRKSYNLFIEDITQDNIKNTLSNNDDGEAATPDIGINFFAPETYGLKSKYSVGTSGLNPFVRARFSLNFQTDTWYIEPVQQFKYSVNNRFEEETSLYFDKLISNAELLRYVLYRGTKEEEYGMDYSFSIQYFRSLKNNTAFNITQTFTGNTQYKYLKNSPDIPENYSEFPGINKYYTGFNWRQNIWKKWFYYEITPGVSFNREYDYDPNYSILFSIDMYFGKLYKNR